MKKINSFVTMLCLSAVLFGCGSLAEKPSVLSFVAHGTGGIAASARTLERSLSGAAMVNPIGIDRDSMSQAEERLSQWLGK